MVIMLKFEQSALMVNKQNTLQSGETCSIGVYSIVIVAIWGFVALQQFHYLVSVI